jgi:hypothetical protein
MSIIKKNSSVFNKRETIKPRRFYVELAEVGMLESFLKNYMPKEFENDKAFRQEMLEILFEHSSTPSVEVEMIYLESMCETIGYFLEYTKPWRNQKP